MRTLPYLMRRPNKSLPLATVTSEMRQCLSVGDRGANTCRKSDSPKSQTWSMMASAAPHANSGARLPARKQALAVHRSSTSARSCRRSPKLTGHHSGHQIYANIGYVVILWSWMESQIQLDNIYIYMCKWKHVKHIYSWQREGIFSEVSSTCEYIGAAYFCGILSQILILFACPRLGTWVKKYVQKMGPG